MPPSQLKQLKASLRDSGVLGPQKSKKQRKTTNKDAQKRGQRNAALEGIRERFNPFEAKAPGRREKFEIASNKPTKKTIERPGVTRGLGEERRRETLLKEMQSRNKVGGLLDRRFGEDDPNMTPEQKAAERFAQQALRANRKSSMFNLEEESEEEMQLTHGGRALTLKDEVVKDDFDEEISASEADEFDAQDDRPRKRARFDGDEGAQGEDEETEIPERKKTKQEVMQEVIAKSKAYKAARQAAKEDDDDLRLELDKGMSDLFSALQGKRTQPKQLPSPPTTDSEPTLDPSRAAMLAGKSREEAEKEYEANLRQLKLEARSKPSVRTKSMEEKAAEEKARLEDLERKRLRRMKGEADTSDEESEAGGMHLDQDQDPDDAEAFGLEQPQPQPRYIPQLEVEDEDEFVMDDIVASDSEANADADSDADGEDDSDASQEYEDDGDDDFINGLVLPKHTSMKAIPSKSAEPTPNLPFTFPCPQDYDELVDATRNVQADDLPTVVQRIRALYHKQLAEGNSERLGNFAKALVPWISSLVNGQHRQAPSMQVIEQLIRHLHSMAKAQPTEVSASFREYFRGLVQQDHISFSPGDLIILTSVSTIFPTSDQWHSVVTPAMSLLARYLAQAPMDSTTELLKGSYVCALLLRYQVRSERYVPEAVNFICKGVQLVGPVDKKTALPSLTTPEIMDAGNFHITKVSKKAPGAKLSFQDIRASSSKQTEQSPQVSSESLLLNFINLAGTCIELYSGKFAFSEIVAPIRTLVVDYLSQANIQSLLHPTTKSAISDLTNTLTSTINTSLTNRKPLFLHNHRPLAIKSSYPAFTDDYNPERRHQDPDRERAELNKLKAEHRKERKGAMRELRKDANFMAREQLREKKAKDDAYDKKFKKLVAEIQGEEGREAKEYEREKAKRKGRF